MHWLWIPLIAIAAIVLIPVVVGRFLPERYEGLVRVRLARPPEDVWAAYADYQSCPMTGSMRKATEALPDERGLPRWVEDMGSSRITVTTLEAQAPTRVVRHMKDSVVPMTARHEVRIEPDGDGSLLTASTEIVLQSGTWHVPIFRFMLTCFGGARKGIKDTLGCVARKLEVTPEYL